MYHKSKNATSIFYAVNVSMAILFASTSALAQVEKQEKVSPVLPAENNQNIDNSNSNTLITKPQEDGTKHECSNYTCTCAIGSDCDEMFESLKIVSCKDGDPGELECRSEPK